MGLLIQPVIERIKKKIADLHPEVNTKVVEIQVIISLLCLPPNLGVLSLGGEVVGSTGNQH